MAPYAGQAMELLGPSLWDEWNSRGAGSMPVPFVACVAVEALRILEGLHERGCALCNFSPMALMESPCMLMLTSLGLPPVICPWTLSLGCSARSCQGFHLTGGQEMPCTFV